MPEGRQDRDRFRDRGFLAGVGLGGSGPNRNLQLTGQRFCFTMIKEKRRLLSRAGREERARLDVVTRLDGPHLRVEHAVLVDHTFGRSRAARREQDGGHIFPPSLDRRKGLTRLPRQAAKRRSAPEPTASDSNHLSDALERSTMQHSHDMCER